MTDKPRVRVPAGQVYIQDGMANFITGLGKASNNKLAGNTYVINQPSQHELDTAFRTSSWFRKIVVTRPRDQFRYWRAWQSEADDVELLENEEKRLNYRQHVLQAEIWEQLYGGAAIIAIGLPGLLPTELNYDRIGLGTIQRLVTVPRYALTPVGVISDPINPGYGGPQYFRMQGAYQQLTIHPSRVFAFRNGMGHYDSQREFWGDSIWMRLEDAIQPVDASNSIIAALFQEAKVDIVKVANLTQNMVNQEAEDRYIKRFMLSNLLKSIQNTVLIDSADEWNQKTINWSGIPDAMMHQMTVMAGAADYPIVKLLGVQATGLNNDGSGDLKNYYDGAACGQELDITPKMHNLDECLIRSATGARDPSTWYQWNPLFQMTPKEKADIDKLYAETTQIYASSGMIPDEPLALATQQRMIDSGLWPGLEAAIEEFGWEPTVDEPMFDDQGNQIDASGKVVSKAIPANSNKPGSKDLSVKETKTSKKKVAARDARLDDATPRTLYVYRPLLNAKAIIAHYKKQGINTTLLPDDMHTTITYSRAAVDWMKMGDNWSGDEKGNLKINPGGPRMMELFSGGALVLLFASSTLSWRHESMKHNGASWDYPEYQPHITISYDSSAVDPAKIVAWQGPILLGPEVFEELDELKAKPEEK